MKQDELILTEEKIDRDISYFQSLFGLSKSEQSYLNTNDTPASKNLNYESKN